MAMLQVDVRRGPPGAIVVCTIKPQGFREFEEILRELKSIPHELRNYNSDTRVWKVFNAERFVSNVPPIKVALEAHKKQLRLF